MPETATADEGAAAESPAAEEPRAEPPAETEPKAAPPAKEEPKATAPQAQEPSAAQPEPQAQPQGEPAATGDAISVDPSTDLPQGAVARTRAALEEDESTPTDAEIDAIKPEYPHPDFDPYAGAWGAAAAFVVGSKGACLLSPCCSALTFAWRMFWPSHATNTATHPRWSLK